MSSLLPFFVQRAWRLKENSDKSNWKLEDILDLSERAAAETKSRCVFNVYVHLYIYNIFTFC